MINHFWTEFDQNNYTTYPPEGETVMTSDGHKYYPLYYIWSSEYRWANYSSDIDDEISLPFEPTHWITFEDFKIFLRDLTIDGLLSDGQNIDIYKLFT